MDAGAEAPVWREADLSLSVTITNDSLPSSRLADARLITLQNPPVW